MMKRIHAQKNKGFTIMETLIAISLLLLAVTGPMVYAQNALRAAFNSRDQITAYFLAQDAIEFVKNIRDDNLLKKSSTWLDGLSRCMDNDGCTVDTSTGQGKIETCEVTEIGCLGSSDDASQDRHLKIDLNGIIGHNGNRDSVFSRVVYITQNIDEAKVVVKVRWKSHENIGAREITVVEYIYNWAGEIL